MMNVPEVLTAVWLGAAIPHGPNARAPSKTALKQLMGATSKFIEMSEWVADQRTTDEGPDEAKAFLDKLLADVGVLQPEPVVEGVTEPPAGE